MSGVTVPALVARSRPVAVYLLVVAVGAAAFLYPFWLPAGALADSGHTGDAPLVAATVGALVVAAVTLELRRATMNGATVALLGVLSATAGLLRLVDLPGGGSGIFFLVILAGAAFGPRFGMLLGLCAMATSAVITGGIGPWLPFQMLVLGWLGGASGLAGHFTRRLPPMAEVVVLAAVGWVAGFLFGAVMNLWFWPFTVGSGELAWHPGLSFTATLQRYWSFYVATSLPWDAAGALANAVLILITGRHVLPALRRVADRLAPVVELVPERDGGGPGEGPPPRLESEMRGVTPPGSPYVWADGAPRALRPRTSRASGRRSATRWWSRR
ncbi:MAG TPA: ECF transporter S component [Acidimicrobiales bacterium]|nr:ECF transporter S component [Acidimicrobiales bacterium]